MVSTLGYFKKCKMQKEQLIAPHEIKQRGPGGSLHW